MLADAVIVYISNRPPHYMTLNNQPDPSFPCVRFQCETGRTELQKCNFELSNFITDFTRKNIFEELTTDEMTARIDRQINDIRTIELRIKRDLLDLPMESLEGQQIGIAIRYRDGNKEIDQLCDWQTGTAGTGPNPRNNLEPWGYLEISN